jgi:hypothetical protein
LKLTNNELKSSEANQKKFNEKIKELKATQRMFYNFCSLVNHLSIQDEIDKQNISLLGGR